MRTALAFLIAFIIRGTERLLPARGLYWALKPFSFSRLKKPKFIPGCFPEAKELDKRRWVNPLSRLNHALEFLADRLSSPKWRGCCRIIGKEAVERARKEGRPTVLAFVHVGPYFLIPCWLRSAGIPLIVVRTGKAENRPAIKQMTDRLSPFPGIPTVLYLDQLREVVAALSAANVLMIAIDYPTGKQVDIALDDDWTFRMATGAIRLAARYNAELIPCCIIEEGAWRFRIELGKPVPAEYLAGEPDTMRAGKHLLTELLPHMRTHLDQCRAGLLRSFHCRAMENSPEPSRA